MLIVTLEHAIAAPFCTRQLADLGARVIKVERPGEGDFARAYDSRAHGSASHFVWCNRSKESLTLDLKHPDARAVLQKLVERADVLVQNLAPGAAARMGLDHASLAPVNPRIVVCDISGYGDGGPYTEKKAYDLLIQSEAGFVSVTGTPEHPSKAGLSIADIAAGMYAYSSVLAALLERGRTGRGQRLEISMLEAMSEWMGFPLYYTLDGQPPPPRAGASHAAIYPYGPFACGDGKQVVLAVQHDREWATFCNQVLQLPDLATRYLGNAKRKVSGLDANRLAMQIAVLEKHGGLRLSDQDVFASSAGGLRVAEPAADLAIALAIAGAHQGRAVDAGTAVIGELGLGGEVRRVSNCRQRCVEAKRLGYERILAPAGNSEDVPPGRNVSLVARVGEALEALRIRGDQSPKRHMGEKNVVVGTGVETTIGG